MKSLSVLVFIGALNIQDIEAMSVDPLRISNKEHNEYQEYFLDHPQSIADKKIAWNEGMLHHIQNDYVSEAPQGYMFSQQQTRDDPCIGLGCSLHTVGSKTAFGDFPKGYAVPNFGKDPDMVTTMNSLDIAQNATGHNLVMGTAASKSQWHNKALDTMYKFNEPLDSDVITT
jgi:hypothetical protein